MRRDLHAPLPAAPLPPGVTLASWTPALAARFFAAYQAAFRDRPGFPGWSAEQWIDWATGDPGLRPHLSVLASHGDQPVGFLICGDNSIDQTGVRPEWRGRGVCSAIVVETLRRLRGEGCDHALLTVNVNNPSAARLYRRLGFAPIGRRARYVRELE